MTVSTSSTSSCQLLHNPIPKAPTENLGQSWTPSSPNTQKSPPQVCSGLFQTLFLSQQPLAALLFHEKHRWSEGLEQSRGRVSAPTAEHGTGKIQAHNSRMPSGQVNRSAAQILS